MPRMGRDEVLDALIHVYGRHRGRHPRAMLAMREEIYDRLWRRTEEWVEGDAQVSSRAA